jgi:3'-phosphoadenosine 5'-phosphosulfate sulfotransferase (PAPS reductase)/FAD synthetase
VTDKKCVVFFSGGAASWAAGKLAAEKYGAHNTVLLFTDTLIEDPDLYRFLEDASKNIGVSVTRIAEGRTPWEVFRDVKIMGNSRIDPCSRVLKREPAEKWLKENCDPQDTVLVFGIDWTESHRYDNGEGRGVKNRYARLGWPHVEALCTLSPTMAKWDVFAWLEREGIKRPRLYDLGFAHNNCGGGCVKAGIGHWLHALDAAPMIFAHWERKENEFNAARHPARPQTMLTDRRGGKRVPMSLSELRKREATEQERDELGGCGCFIEDGEDE